MGRPKSKCWVYSKKWYNPLHDLPFPCASLSPSGKWADSYPTLTTILAIPLADRCDMCQWLVSCMSLRGGRGRDCADRPLWRCRDRVLPLPMARKEGQGLSRPSHPLLGQHNLYFVFHLFQSMSVIESVHQRSAWKASRGWAPER